MRRERLFVALDLPEAVRAEIDDWGRRALADPALRRVAAESLHITLAFLGDLEEGAVGRVAPLAAGAVAGAPAPAISLSGPVPRPERGRPRLLALAAESPGAVALQAEVSKALAGAGLYRPEKRPFWPHVTVARVRSDGSGRRRPAAVARLPGALPEALSRAFDGVRVTLYRSELQSQGAQYTPLAQVELPRGGRQ